VNGAPHAKVLDEAARLHDRLHFQFRDRRNESALLRHNSQKAISLERSSASRTGVRDMPVARHTSASVRNVPSVLGNETTCFFSHANTTSCAASGLAPRARVLWVGAGLIIGMMYTSRRHVWQALPLGF
jgi:hypothetical protein